MSKEAWEQVTITEDEVSVRKVIDEFRQADDSATYTVSFQKQAPSALIWPDGRVAPTSLKNGFIEEVDKDGHTHGQGIVVIPASDIASQATEVFLSPLR